MSEDLVRAVPNWIDSFMEYTEPLLTTPQYRRWTAYSLISGVLERRVWAHILGFQCFPSMFVLMVAEPGVGKSVVIKETVRLWKSCRGVNIGPNGMTKAALIDHMNDECRHEVFYNGKASYYYPLCLGADEFGQLFPDHNTELMNVFNVLYDCDDGFSDRTRGHGMKVVEKPFMTMLAGTQPDYLGLIMPPIAWGMGFMSRTIMVHGTEDQQTEGPVFGRKGQPEHIKDHLVHDLKIMQKLVGEMIPSEAGIEWMEEWFKHRKLDEPKHPLLKNYNKRRHASIMKLAMINSLARDNELTVELDDFEEAYFLLTAAEKEMPDIFSEMTSSPDKRSLEEIHRWCFRYLAAKKINKVPEHALMDYIHGKVDVQRAKYFLQSLIDSRKIIIAGAANPGQREFIPKEGEE